MATSLNKSRKRPLICAWLLLLTACSSGTLTSPEPDASPDAGCSEPCPVGQICQNGRCIERGEDPCARVDCPPGQTCLEGSCIANDPCEDVVCPNPHEVCRNGSCVRGDVDGDSDGYLAIDDCDDENPDIHPGAYEACNGILDACDASIGDGADECPEHCCGVVAACRECCVDSHCGGGDWLCSDDFTCSCGGRVCGGECLADAECCTAADCGRGDWTCTAENRCSCSGRQCGSECRLGAECCSGSECGSGDWTCTSTGQCLCTGLLCGSECVVGGECCQSTDCGSGDWTCTATGQCLCACHSCDGHCYGDGPCCEFDDVTSSYWAHDAISAVCDAGFASGCSGANFCPTTVASRAEMASILALALGVSLSSAASNAYFDDVATHWSAPYVNTLYEQGVTNGCATRAYCPDDDLIRDSAAVFISRALGLSPSAATYNAYYSDLDPTGYATPYINALHERGIVDGCGGGRFCPTDSMIRASLAALIASAYLCL